MKTRRSFVLTPALALAHISAVLALHPAALGRAQTLMAEDDGVGVAVAEDSGVALMHVRGPLTQRTTMQLCGVSLGYDSISAAFSRLMDEPTVSAVVLVIDSPGGDIAGLFGCVAEMQAARDAAAKPVLAYADELACSAAYAIACVANAGIYLPSSGEVGSVGVLTIHEDQSAAAEQAGVRWTVIKSGARKAEGNPFEPLSDVAHQAIQSNIDTLAEEFFSLVVASRGLRLDQVKGLEGAALLGQAAVAAGLADGLAPLAQVVALAARAAAAEGTPMTADEKKEMEALKARLQAAEDKLAAIDQEEKPSDEEEPPPSEQEPSDEEDPKEEVAALKAELGRRDIAAAVDAASRQGRIEPSRRAAMIALGERVGLDSLRVVLDAMPPHKVARTATTKSAPTAGPTLTALELTIATNLGVTPEAFAASKTKIAQSKEHV